MSKNEDQAHHITKSLVIPVYKNEENLVKLLGKLNRMSTEYGTQFEVVFVVDGSPDNSAAILYQQLAHLPYKAQVIAHSRNYGSFTAIRTGLEYATGKYIAIMAADLQEPVELIDEFFEVLENDAADVVFGQRIGREDSIWKKMLANLFWTTYRKTVLPEMPRGGVDIFACNRIVRDSVLSIEEPNGSLIAQIFWVGFRRRFVPYRRQPRLEGKSAWSGGRQIRYMLDSVFSYSDFPILLVLWLGLVGCMMSLIVGSVTLFGKLFGLIDVTGYTTIVLINIFFGFALLLSQGVLGCYLWRTLENTKKRPLRIISMIRTNYS